MALTENDLGAIYMIMLLRPDTIYILPDSNKFYTLNADQSDLVMHEIDSLWNMTDDEVNAAIKNYFKS